MEEAIAYAKKYVEDLLSFFGLNCDVYATHEDEVIELSIPSTYLNGFLIGQRGETMRALQFMVSTALRQQGFDTYRVNLDIAEYKKQRQERLIHQVNEWIQEVIKANKSRHLSPMNAADRRIVHKAVSDSGAVSSESEGEGRDRHVVLHPIAVTDESTGEDQVSVDVEDESSEA
jgi:spoIIIJ-associated protein